MRDLVRYLAGYLLDQFRERVTAEEATAAGPGRVLVTPGFDSTARSAIRRTFPRAELFAFGNRSSLASVRRGRFDVCCIPMSGGGTRERLIGLLSGARHKLLIPSPDYVYRLGMRAGWPALIWAVVDRFLLAPVALAWLGLIATWLYAAGVVGRARGSAEGGRRHAFTARKGFG